MTFDEAPTPEPSTTVYEVIDTLGIRDRQPIPSGKAVADKVVELLNRKARRDGQGERYAVGERDA